jgi:hypothetical protein
MSLFNIDNTINVENNSTPRLKANEIHKVQLKEVKADDLKGKDGKTYQVIYLKFQNDEGSVYEQRFFPPTATDAIGTGSFGQQATDLSQFRYSIQHLIEALNPNLFKQIKEGKKFTIKDWDSMRKFVVQAFTPGINIDVYLKLVADNKGYAAIPKYPVGLSKSGELYMKTRFVASVEHQEEKPIVFTDQEKKNMENQAKANSAKPSSMSDVDFEKSKPKGDDFDI